METGNDFDDKRGRLIRERIQRLCLFDDEFMTRCFDGGTDCVELVLRKGSPRRARCLTTVPISCT